MQINHQANANEKAKAELKLNSIISDLEGKTPAQINTYVENNVTSVADVKNFIKLFLLYIQADSK